LSVGAFGFIIATIVEGKNIEIAVKKHTLTEKNEGYEEHVPLKQALEQVGNNSTIGWH